MRIKSRERVVEKQDIGVRVQSPRDRDTSALSAFEICARLTNGGVFDTTRQPGEVFVQSTGPNHTLLLQTIKSLRTIEVDVVTEISRNTPRILRAVCHRAVDNA